MSQRRTLVTGLEDTPDVKTLERKFVYGDKLSAKDTGKDTDASVPTATNPNTATNSDDILPQYRGRVPLTTRCRPELATALKRASLKRQLEGREPARIQEIIEEAVKNWLVDNDYFV